MSYIVLARRWRPRFFEEVVGQEHVARTLQNAIDQDRVAHAFLFCGPRGVGKTSMARILAKALNCAEGPTGKPCYACPSCEEISRGSSVDVFEIDGASNRGVGEIRELREGVRYAPGRDRHKIYIIDEVHMLTTEAFNALLKTLEEPPPHVKFIFATTEPQKIPVTILSRCQRFDFKRISVRRIVEWLTSILGKDGVGTNPAALNLIARQADGCMRDALSLTDQVISFSSGNITAETVAEILGVASRETLFELSGALLAHDVETALGVLDSITASGHDLPRFAAALVAHFRDLTVVRVTGQVGAMIDLTEEEVAVAQSQVSNLDPSVLHRMFGLMVKSAEDMTRSSFPKLIFEMALVKLAAIEPLMPMDLLLQRLKALESGLFIGGDDPSGGGGSGSGPSTGGGAPQSSGGSGPSYSAAPTPAPSVRGAAEPRALAPAPEPPEDNIVPFRPTPPPADPPPAFEATPPTQSKPEPAPTPEPTPEVEIRVEAPPIAAEPDVHANGAQTNGVHKLNGADPAPTEISTAWTQARESWRQVVVHLIDKPTISSVLREARLKALNTGVIALEMPSALADIIDFEQHTPLIAAAANEALAELHDGPWEITFDVADDGEEIEGHHHRSLATEDDERLAARRAKAREIISSHQIITQAEAIFAPRHKKIVLDEDFFAEGPW